MRDDPDGRSASDQSKTGKRQKPVPHRSPTSGVNLTAPDPEEDRASTVLSTVISCSRGRRFEFAAFALKGLRWRVPRNASRNTASTRWKHFHRTTNLFSTLQSSN